MEHPNPADQRDESGLRVGIRNRCGTGCIAILKENVGEIGRGARRIIPSFILKSVSK